jgi:hopanoid biosynthesis associated protein HpnK
LKSLIVCADDFGLDPAVNEAVEEAFRDGILTCASLMVAAPAAADAVACARRMPGLRVGLHLVLVDGEPLLPGSELPRLSRGRQAFDKGMLRSGLRFSLVPGIGREIAAEIAAQFRAFAASGLKLDHVNFHKHMHLHPRVARLAVRVGRDFGMRAMRLPAEPRHVLCRAFPQERPPLVPYRPAVAALRRRLRRAGLAANDQVFGIAWSGGMTEERLLALLPLLPDGVSEIYCHPATRDTIPGTRPQEELRALTSPRVRRLIEELGLRPVSYADLAAEAP